MNQSSFKPLSVMLLLLTMIIGSALSGCGNSGSEVIKIVTERDSLRVQNQVKTQQLLSINEMISTLNGALDSIYKEENLIFLDPLSEKPVNRIDALNNLDRFEAVLLFQKEKIDKLEASLSDSEQNGNFQGLIGHMKTQLAEKNAQIASLRTELSQKNVDINRLRNQIEVQRNQIDDQAAAIAELDRRTQAQTRALVVQDEMLNVGYVLLGSKKDLERKGIVRKKRLVSDSALDKSKFAKVDIRKWTEISFFAKRPRILTDTPSSAYKLTTTGDNNFTLQVTNPTDFWSVSNFLVIQTD